MFNSPYMSMPRPSLFNNFSSLIKGVNWGGILDGTQKTLGVINQAIPVVYQVKPIINNAKTMFKIAGTLKDNNNISNNNNNIRETYSYQNNISSNNNKPIFYL